MIFTQEYINTVKRKTEMVKLAMEYVSDLKKGTNKVWIGSCPHPDHDDKDPSFRVWEKSQSWGCMGCHSGKKSDHNFGSDCIAFIRWIKNFSFEEAVLHLAQRIGMEEPQNPYQKYYEKNMQLITKYSDKLTNKVREYLYQRGLSDHDIEKWQIGFDGERITFPLFDRYKRVLGFSRRIFEKDGPKYINSANSDIFNKSYYFYGIHLLDPDFEEARITEGCFDVVLAKKYGVRNVICPLGSAITDGHIDILKTLGKTPVFLMDGDEPGKKAVKRHAEALSQAGIYSKILTLPEEQDLAEFALEHKNDSEKAIQDSTVTYGYYLVQGLLSDFEAQLHEMRLKIYPKVKEIVQNISHKDEQVLIKSLIQERMNIQL